MQRFESIVSWLLLIGLIGGGLYFYPHEIRTVAYELVNKVAPCSIPITYKIGSIDPKFGISERTLATDLEKASGLWSAAAGKKVFVYDQTNGIVEVNLQYDSRQEMTKELKSMGLTVSNDRASYDELRAKYDSVFAAYTAKKTMFQQQADAFTAAKSAYEKNVAYWNARGGAPKQEFANLQATQSALSVQSDALQRSQDELNSMVTQVNDLAQALNRLIDVLKLEVNKYNETGQSHGESFEQGVYERTVGKETITIYEYENNALLTRVLAHEFGHALGLDHVEDPEAIMYYLNQGSTIALSKSDVDALTAHCKSWW